MCLPLTVAMQLAEMPVTPLGQLMGRFPAREGFADDRRIEVGIKKPMPAQPPAEGILKPEALQPVSEAARNSISPMAPLCVATRGAASEESCIARYASRDPLTGRVWGVPSAFGKGQCIDCPRRCAPPSMRCVDCQIAAAHQTCEPMEAHDFQQLQIAFATAFATCSSLKRGNIEKRINQLYSRLQAGKISVSVQAQLLGISQALSSNNHAAAAKSVALISAENWNEHKEWIVGLKQLLSCQ